MMPDSIYNMTDEDTERALAAINGWLRSRPGVFGPCQDETDLWHLVFREVNPRAPCFPLAFMKAHVLRCGVEDTGRGFMEDTGRGFMIDLTDPELAEDV